MVQFPMIHVCPWCTTSTWMTSPKQQEHRGAPHFFPLAGVEILWWSRSLWRSPMITNVFLGFWGPEVIWNVCTSILWKYTRAYIIFARSLLIYNAYSFIDFIDQHHDIHAMGANNPPYIHVEASDPYGCIVTGEILWLERFVCWVVGHIQFSKWSVRALHLYGKVT